MDLADLRLMYDYNDWADDRILSASARLPHEQFVAPGSYPWGGLRGTLAHTLDAHYSWRRFFAEGAFPPDELTETGFATFDALQQRWHEEASLMRSYLGSLDDGAIRRVVTYVNDAGIKRERVLWHCLYHVVNHGTQHRSESAALLTGFGQSPGDLDFTLFLAELAKRKT
ncbi:MAG: DinB family protein [Anaerolineae bacterium]